MAESRYTDFVPRWARTESGDWDDGIPDVPVSGVGVDTTPRLPTRILPSRGGHTLTAPTLSEVISLTQRILTYVSYDVVHGARLDFADLRAVASDEVVQRLSKLNVAPFSEGSFVIPASLSDEPVTVGVEGKKKTVDGHDVLRRFVMAMNGIADEESAFPASLGLVQTVEDLGRVIRREADAIEYYALGMSQEGPTESRIVVDEAYVKRVSANKHERQDPRIESEAVEGHITAVDVTQGTFKIRLSKKSTIRGQFGPLIQDRMIRSLNKRAIVEGEIDYLGGRKRFIRAYFVEPQED